MKDTLLDIREKLKDGVYTNEEHVRLSLVGRILQELGWDLWNPREVNSEFAVVPEEDQSRVDLALFLNTYSPVVFIEVKAVGKLIGNIAKIERQLRDYNRNNTALFSIITDGQKWRFYYSQTGGEFSQKRFKTLDVLEDDIDDVEMFFDVFLSKNEISNGSAEREAKHYLQLNQKQRAMGDALPKARRLVSEPPFPSLPQALVQLTKAAGYSVTMEEASDFIQKSATREPDEPLSDGMDTNDEDNGKSGQMEPEYIDSFRKQLRNPNNLISKIKRYIDEKGVVKGNELKRTCVKQFGCKSETSGSIGASLQALERSGHIRIEGKGDHRRISSTQSRK